MRLTFALALSLALATAAAAQTAAKFDLICNGTMSYANGKSEGINQHYRIDLTRHLFCDDSDCRPSMLTVLPTELDLPSIYLGGTEMTMKIDRTTGQLQILGRSLGGSTDGMVLGQGTAACTKAPFSGMPGNQF